MRACAQSVRVCGSVAPCVLAAHTHTHTHTHMHTHMHIPIKTREAKNRVAKERLFSLEAETRAIA